MGAAEIPRGGSRVKALQRWLAGRADTSVGRLTLQWFRSYFAASRNSACAVSLYSALSVLPTALVGVAYLHLSSSDSNAFADRIVSHLRLHGDTAQLVHATFASASANIVSATAVAVAGFLLWGIGIGQLYRDVYVRAWKLELDSGAADQVRYTVFFFAFSGVVALGVLTMSRLQGLGWVWLVLVWTAGCTAFWLWTPSYLLRGAVGVRALLPGALLASLVLGGTVATSPFWLAPTMNQNGAAFGSFGVVLTLLAYLFIMVTMTTVCAVFPPVWREWRSSP
jgi:uncharacterized BrkB/YihY/UPF0761 family membrane protein